MALLVPLPPSSPPLPDLVRYGAPPQSGGVGGREREGMLMYLTPGSSRRAGRAQVPGSGPAGTRRPGAQHGASRAASGAQFLLPVVTPGPLGAADTDCPPRAAQARPLKRRAAWLDFRSPFPVDAAAGKEKRVDSETGVSAGPGPSGPGEGPSPRGPLRHTRGWMGREPRLSSRGSLVPLHFLP